MEGGRDKALHEEERVHVSERNVDSGCDDAQNEEERVQENGINVDGGSNEGLKEEGRVYESGIKVDGGSADALNENERVQENGIKVEGGRDKALHEEERVHVSERYVDGGCNDAQNEEERVQENGIKVDGGSNEGLKEEERVYESGIKVDGGSTEAQNEEEREQENEKNANGGRNEIVKEEGRVDENGINFDSGFNEGLKKEDKVCESEKNADGGCSEAPNDEGRVDENVEIGWEKDTEKSIADEIRTTKAGDSVGEVLGMDADGRIQHEGETENTVPQEVIKDEYIEEINQQNKSKDAKKPQDVKIEKTTKELGHQKPQSTEEESEKLHMKESVEHVDPQERDNEIKETEKTNIEMAEDEVDKEDVFKDVEKEEEIKEAIKIKEVNEDEEIMRRDTHQGERLKGYVKIEEKEVYVEGQTQGKTENNEETIKEQGKEKPEEHQISEDIDTAENNSEGLRIVTDGNEAKENKVSNDVTNDEASVGQEIGKSADEAVVVEMRSKDDSTNALKEFNEGTMKTGVGVEEKEEVNNIHEEAIEGTNYLTRSNNENESTKEELSQKDTGVEAAKIDVDDAVEVKAQESPTEQCNEVSDILTGENQNRDVEEKMSKEHADDETAIINDRGNLSKVESDTAEKENEDQRNTMDTERRHISESVEPCQEYKSEEINEEKDQCEEIITGAVDDDMASTSKLNREALEVKCQGKEGDEGSGEKNEEPFYEHNGNENRGTEEMNHERMSTSSPMKTYKGESVVQEENFNSEEVVDSSSMCGVLTETHEDKESLGSTQRKTEPNFIGDQKNEVQLEGHDLRGDQTIDNACMEMDEEDLKNSESQPLMSEAIVTTPRDECHSEYVVDLQHDGNIVTEEKTDMGSLTELEANEADDEKSEVTSEIKKKRKFNTEVEGQRIQLSEKLARKQAPISSPPKRRPSSSKQLVVKEEKSDLGDRKIKEESKEQKMQPKTEPRITKRFSSISLGSPKKPPPTRRTSDITPQKCVTTPILNSPKTMSNDAPTTEAHKEVNLPVMEYQESQNKEEAESKSTQEEKAILQEDLPPQQNKEIKEPQPVELAKAASVKDEELMVKIRRRLSMVENTEPKESTSKMVKPKVFKRYSSLKELSIEKRMMTPPRNIAEENIGGPKITPHEKEEENKITTVDEAIEGTHDPDSKETFNEEHQEDIEIIPEGSITASRKEADKNTVLGEEETKIGDNEIFLDDLTNRSNVELSKATEKQGVGEDVKEDQNAVSERKVDGELEVPEAVERLDETMEITNKEMEEEDIDGKERQEDSALLDKEIVNDKEGEVNENNESKDISEIIINGRDEEVYEYKDDKDEPVTTDCKSKDKIPPILGDNEYNNVDVSNIVSRENNFEVKEQVPPHPDDRMEEERPWVVESWTCDAGMKDGEEVPKTEDIVEDNVKKASVHSKESYTTDDMKTVLRKKISTTSYKALPVETYLISTRTQDSKDAKEERKVIERSKKKNLFILDAERNKPKKKNLYANQASNEQKEMQLVTLKAKLEVRQRSHRTPEKRIQTAPADPKERKKTVSSNELEYKRIKTNIEEIQFKIQKNQKKKKEFEPYVFNNLQPYSDTKMYEVVRQQTPRPLLGATSRVTAIDLCDPWENHKMDKIALPSIRDSTSFFTAHVQPKSHRLTLGVRPMSTITKKPNGPQSRPTKSSDYTHRSQSQEGKSRSRATSKKIDEDYQRTRTELYRLSLDKLNRKKTTVSQTNVRSALFAYLQNSPGSKRALYEVVHPRDKVKSEAP